MAREKQVASLPLRVELVKIEINMQKQENILTYTVTFEPDQDGGFVAFVPILPGCMSQGETFEEAKENVKDAIAGYISVLREDGEQIPVESPDRVSACVSVPSML